MINCNLDSEKLKLMIKNISSTIKYLNLNGNDLLKDDGLSLLLNEKFFNLKSLSIGGNNDGLNFTFEGSYFIELI